MRYSSILAYLYYSLLSCNILLCISRELYHILCYRLHSELQCQSQLNKEKYKEVEDGVHTSDPLHLSSLTEVGGYYCRVCAC